MTNEEWETLCDGCGKCCAVGPYGCPALDTNTNRCTRYKDRLENFLCLKVTPENTLRLHAQGILPDSCAYVRYKKGQPPLKRVRPAKLKPWSEAGKGLGVAYSVMLDEWKEIRGDSTVPLEEVRLALRQRKEKEKREKD